MSAEQSTTPRRRFTRIMGLGQEKRLPRLGKIRLGMKVASKKGGERPTDLDFFLFVHPGEDSTETEREYYSRVLEQYGDKPKELPIMLPCESLDRTFPTSYRLYGLNKLKCIGDGAQAERFLCDQCGKMVCRCDKAGVRSEARACPCELLDKRECRAMGSLMVILHEVAVDGVWQVDTGSIHSMIDLTSALDDDPKSPGWLRLLLGRISMVPLVLRRVPRTTHHNGVAAVHHTLKIAFPGSMADVNAVRAGVTAQGALPPPPKLDGDALPAVPEPEVADATPPEDADLPEDYPDEPPEPVDRQETLPEEDPLGDLEKPAEPVEPITDAQRSCIRELRKAKGLHRAENFTAWLWAKKLPPAASLTAQEAERIIAALKAEPTPKPGEE